MPAPVRPVAIAAGANLGDPAAQIRAAFGALAHSSLISNATLSPLYRTAPVRVVADGPDPGGEYVNAAIVAESNASPEALLALLHDVERRGGRDRGICPHGSPRPIDLDLLVVGDLVFRSFELTIPHPRMHERAFVLAPLADVAPGLAVPAPDGGPGVSVGELLRRLGPLDAASVRRIDP
ncbi:MAG TPA: 2-amino-4-hydroxy-6-hydroxymethyldihydropteridine diphosphokinase [Phycisphaerales bacterium]|nr:2-amino-4-hydroxy-6-hydroxymethyldihydropteridine diphosphokinase [Phycisphaerales bacterium]